MKHNHPEHLPQFAHDLIEHYWILCTPADAVAHLVFDYSEASQTEMGFVYDDHKVTPEEFLGGLNDVIRYFMSRRMWPTGIPQVSEPPRKKTLNIRRWWKSR